MTDERWKTLKPGESVRVKGWGSSPVYVEMQAASGKLLCRATPRARAFFIDPADILWPDPPKAVPGEVYRHTNGLHYIGRFDGKVQHGSLGWDFDPTSYTIVLRKDVK